MSAENNPKGRDIMAVFTFYNGDVIEQKITGVPYCRELETIKAALDKTWLAFDNGLIRQTKDIEKVVWIYC